jgi:thioredoxin 1
MSILLIYFKFVLIMAVDFSSSSFQNDVLGSDKPVLVDFWAEWCGPCKMIGPIVEELHNEYEGKAVIGKLNVDENPDIAMNYGVRNIPTLLIFKGGEVVDKIVGAVPKSTIASKIENQL